MADHFYSVAAEGQAMEYKRNDIVVTVSGSQRVGTAAAQATVTADIATLVADGATPTQAHVNTLNTDYTAFLATLTAGNPIELRITDGAVLGKEASAFCEFLADLLRLRDKQVIPAGTLKI